MTIPHSPITPIPDTEPDAVPALWNDRYAEIDDNFEAIDSAVTAIQSDIDFNVSGVDTAEVISADWSYRGNIMYAEKWTERWRLLDPISLSVTTAIANSNAVDVDSTADLVEGQYYVIKSGTSLREIIQVDTVVSETRFNAAAPLTNTYPSGSIIARTTFAVSLGSAVANNQDVYFAGPLYSENNDAQKKLVIQRTENMSALKVYFYDDANSTEFTECSVSATRYPGTDNFEAEYIIPTRGNTQFKIMCDDPTGIAPVTIRAIYFFEASMFKTIFTDTKYHVAPSPVGSDLIGEGTALKPWATIDKAMDFLQTYWIASGATVTIELADGQHNYTDSIDLKHPCGSRIIISGKNVYDVNITALISTTGGAVDGLHTNYPVVFSVGDTDHIAVDDYMLVNTITTPTTMAAYAGVHKVTAVDPELGRVTLSVRHTTVAQPSAGLCTMTAMLIKSVVNFTSEIGFYLDRGAILNSIKNLVVAGNYVNAPTIGAGGISVWNGSQTKIGGAVGVTGFSNAGISCRDLSSVICEDDGYYATSKCGAGVMLSGNCFLSVNLASFISSGSGIGVQSDVNSAFHANRNASLYIVGNSTYGLSASTRALIFLGPTAVQVEGNALTTGSIFIASSGGYILVKNAYTALGTNGTASSPAVNTLGNEQGYVDTP